MAEHTYDYEYFEGEALRELRATGLGEAPRPPGDAGTIVDPTGVVLDFGDVALDDWDWPALGRWLGVLAGWIAYARHLVGITGCIRVAAGAEAKRAKARAYLASEKPKVTDARAEAEADPVVRACTEVEEAAHARMKLLEGRLGGLEQQYAAISREQARREGEHREAGPIRRRP